MPARTGEHYLKGLKASNRELWLGSERVGDVTEHPALQGAAHSMARVFDRQHQCADDCLMADPETGEAINVSHLIPHSKEDLWRRHRGLERIAEVSVGLMGRTPDYKNVTFAGFAGRRNEWAGKDGSNAEGADNLVAFQKRLRRNDIALTHTLVHPTVDKRNGDVPRPGAEVPLHKVGETKDGIVVRGARILATSAPFADEMVVYPGFPLIGDPDGLAPYALSFVTPMDTPGLVFLCRDSFSVGGDPFDRPLSTNFDEQDAFVIFDNVEIPKENVFINANVRVYSSVMALAWWPNIMQQTTIRALTKLEFAYGLASQMSKAIGDYSDLTADMMGELLTYVEMTRSGLLLAIEHARDYGDGVWFPDERPLAPLRATLTYWVPRAFEILTLIGSHNLIAAPTRGMLDDERLRGLIDTYMAGADDLDAERRSAVFRLAWDFCGSSLAGRHGLYERFYLGSAARNKKTLYWNAEGTMSGVPGPVKVRGDELVEAMLQLGQR
ncbi:MAG: 4-hydroxyphenylacetate 3-hydroxylase N-terminal domain-containing protein [Acidimicrobiales bacterium]